MSAATIATILALGTVPVYHGRRPSNSGDAMPGVLIVLLVLASLAATGWWLRVRAGRERRKGVPGGLAAGVEGPDDATEEERALPGHDLRFTVYRPGLAVPGRWYDLLVFMHEFEPPTEGLADRLRPEERIDAEARRFLGDEAPAYVAATEDAAAAVPREGVLTVQVELPGFRVNPPRQVVAWEEDLQRVGFRIQADPSSRTGWTARGRLTVFHGPLILAEMALVIPVGEGEAAPTSESLTPYRRIFASYARADDAVVRRLGALAESVGDRYLRDVTSLRTGEAWNPGLARLIEQADIFQLFWSWNAMESEWVRREWTHALSLGRPNFVRPVYWEDPLPRRPERGLPPPELSGLHFHRLPGDLVGGPTPGPAGAGSAVPGSGTEAPRRSTGAGKKAEPTGRRAAMDRIPATSRGRFRRSWALPAAAVAILAVGTSTLYMAGGPAATSRTDIQETSAGTGQGGRDAQTGHLVADLTFRGAPVQGVVVRMETADGRVFQATTGTGGQARFEDVPPGTVRLTLAGGVPEGAELPRPAPELPVTPGDTARVVLRLEPGAR